jgi:hypothetical protein
MEKASKINALQPLFSCRVHFFDRLRLSIVRRAQAAHRLLGAAVKSLDTEAAINIGACLTIDKDMNKVIKRIRITESYQDMRVAQKLERDVNF